jgi:hypothetical protein
MPAVKKSLPDTEDPLLTKQQTADEAGVTVWSLDNELRKKPEHNFPLAIWITGSSPRQGCSMLYTESVKQQWLTI